jgi:hypothetical protein
MYHAIIRKRILALFDAINRGDAEPVITGFASKFEHIFVGESALGGRRTSIGKRASGMAGSIGCCPTSTLPWSA